MYKCIYL